MKSPRCVLCYQTQENCFCRFISPTSTTVPLVMLQHWKEQYRSSNTGRLLTLAIPGTPYFTNFNWEQLGAMSRFLESYQPYLLYPSERAISVSQFQEIRRTSSRPVCIVLMDGTWKQVKRLRQRVKTLSGLPCLRLDPEEPSAYQLRRQSYSHHLSTIEAVICLMKKLSCGDPRPLEQLFEMMVQRGLQARGKCPQGWKESNPLLVGSVPDNVGECLEFPECPESEADLKSVIDK